jgi:hypothetical protein
MIRHGGTHVLFYSGHAARIHQPHRRAMFVAVLKSHHGHHGPRSIGDRQVWLS